jgi:asparagine synthase (glutamine-hydrolysing)
MCGIAGIINTQDFNPGTLEKMSLVLSHRGPDDEGYILINRDKQARSYRGNDTIHELDFLPHIHDNKESGFIGGIMHRRLSIIDTSPLGHQPMPFYNDECFIALNGEIYNYRELREELISLRQHFKSTSDTEVVLASYLEWGPECVDKFIGMWAFAIIDLRKRILFLSRDRFGIKPLYFAANGSSLAFASEIKALFEAGSARPVIDKYKFSEFLLYGNTSDPSGNLFSEVRTLPEGHNLVVPLDDPSQLRVSGYYDLRAGKGFRAGREESVIGVFRDMFDESINLHLRSDVPVGVNLSGGLDSSSITAVMARKMGSIPFRTFTAAYHQKNVDESGYARMVTDIFPNIAPSFVYPNIKDFWEDLDKQIWHHDLPFHSTSMHAQWEVMHLAHSKGIKVLLNGQGSDEMLGGYSSFAGLYLLGILGKLNIFSFLREYSNLKNNMSLSVGRSLGRSLYAWLPDQLKRSARRNFRLGNAFLDRSFINEFGQVNPPEFHSRSFNEMSVRSIKHGLQQLLRYEDRLSMAFSIESRVPFLDHRLVEFAVSLDPSWKIKDGFTKYILRKSTEPFLPQQVTWRRDKMGFLTPAAEWKRELRPQLLDYIRDSTVFPFINRDAVAKACMNENDSPTDTSEFWKMIVTMKWAQIFNVY